MAAPAFQSQKGREKRRRRPMSALCQTSPATLRAGARRPAASSRRLDLPGLKLDGCREPCDRQDNAHQDRRQCDEFLTADHVSLLCRTSDIRSKTYSRSALCVTCDVFGGASAYQADFMTRSRTSGGEAAALRRASTTPSEPKGSISRRIFAASARKSGSRIVAMNAARRALLR